MSCFAGPSTNLVGCTGNWAKGTNHSRRFTFDAIGSVDRAIIDRMRSMLRQAGEQATQSVSSEL
jgi:hypothetical protein